jgi:hypothetical protein
MSEKMKGRVFSDETKAKMSASRIGRKESEKTKAIKSEVMKKRWASPGYREAYHENNIGKVLSEECKAKLSAKAYERWSNPEFKAKMTEIIRNTTPEVMKRPEVRKAISDGRKAYFEKPGSREKQSIAIKKYMSRPEVRAKLSASISKAMNKPEFKAKMKVIYDSPEFKKKTRMTRMRNNGWSENQIRFFEDDEYAKKIIEDSKSNTYYSFMKDFGLYSQQVGRRIRNLNLQDKFLGHNEIQHSQGELELLDFVKTFDEDACCDRKALKGKELDVYSKKNKIAFEFDGLYWHSEQYAGKVAALQKTESCNKLGIRLMHVYENEWWHKQDIVKSMIKSSFCKDRRIFARKCEVVEVSSSEAKKFLDSNHLQGNVNSKYRIGLSFNRELVAVMTFGKPRFNNFDGMELLRFANKTGINVIGGESRLFKNAIRIWGFDKVISYCDRAKFTGNGYLKIGMKFERYTDPSYIWTNGIDILSRYSTQMKDEYATMSKAGYWRVFNCGTSVFTWQR